MPELPPVAVPATSAGALFEVADLEKVRGIMGREYESVNVINNSGAYIEMVDQRNRVKRVFAGQNVVWDLGRGCKWLAVKPSADIAAGEVELVLTQKLVLGGF